MDTKMSGVDIGNGANDDDEVGESNPRQQTAVAVRPDRRQLSRCELLKRHSAGRNVMARLPE